MKKSSLALSVAAALGAMGFAGAAAANGGIQVNPNGVGNQLIVPYFSAQGDNATLLNITNTDTTNGKAVKVRFRGAANSDDLFDFTLLLSPGDVWTAAVTQGADGISKLTTSDKSCTLPQSVVSIIAMRYFQPLSTSLIALVIQHFPSLTIKTIPVVCLQNVFKKPWDSI